MSAMSFFDYVTLSLGWLINNAIWNILATSGIAIIPFIMKIIAIFVKVREQSSFEGNHAPMIVSRIEDYLYISMAIIFFTCYPSINFDPRVLHYQNNFANEVIDKGSLNVDGTIAVQDNSCSYSQLSPTDSKYQSMRTQIDGQDIKVPVWWYLVHSLSSGLTQAAVTAIPCEADLRSVQTSISNLTLSDPFLATETDDFFEMCFNPSINKLQVSKKVTSLTKEEIIDVTWPGSKYFLKTSGYYDTFRAQRPQQRWPYNSQRDVGLTPGEGNTGYPTCNEWWQDSDNGLKNRIINDLEEQGKSTGDPWYKNFYNFLTKGDDERNEILIRAVLNPKKKLFNTNYLFMDYSGDKDGTFLQGVGSHIASVGMWFKSISTYIEMDSVRKTVPMLQSILLMITIILLPIIITVSGYQPKTIITLSFVLFAFIFMTFIWEFARFLDTKLIQMVYKNDAVEFFTNSNAAVSYGSAIEMVTSFVFIGFPLLLLGSLSWAGYNVGSAMSTFMDKNSTQMQKAGSEGINKTKQAGKAAGKVAIKAATKGKG